MVRRTALWWRWLGRFLAVALPLSLAIIVPAYLDHRAAARLHRELGGHLIDLHASIISQEMDAVASDLRYLARQETLRRFVSGETNQETTLLQEYARFCAEKGIYDQIRFLNTDGMEVIRINNTPTGPQVVAHADLQSKGNRYYFENAMRVAEDQVFVSPFDLNMERGEIERPLKPVMRFAIPVQDQAGMRRGVLVLNLMGQGLLQKLRATAQPFPGQAWLVNEAGDFLIGPDESVEWDFMLQRQGRTLKRLYPDAWEAFNAGEHQQYSNPQGLFAGRTVWVGSLTQRGRSQELGPLAGPKLVAISHIPNSVVFAGPRRLLLQMLGIYGLSLVALAWVTWYLAVAADQRQAQKVELQEAHARLRQLAARLISAQEDERRKLSRDLHDDFGQILASVIMDLELAQRASDPERRQRILDQALLATRNLGEKLHEKATEVRPSLLDDVGLRSSVVDLLHRFESRYGLVCDAELEFQTELVPVHVRENVFRILQESLTNVVRHARVREAQVRLQADADRVRLQVIDAGQGFVPGDQKHQRLGLLGMRERVELLGGEFQLVSAPGQGTCITVDIPWAANVTS